jgi:DUF1680 family protein
MKRSFQATAILLTALAVFYSCKNKPAAPSIDGITEINIHDQFWSPKFDQWRTVTVNDVFDKFEGKYDPQGNESLERDFKESGITRDAFHNFDLVAQGKRGTGKHAGPPWYDGLVYETIRGASDFLLRHKDAELEKRIDGYIDRIDAAQASDSTGYINTYTQLVEPAHRWGFNGGFLRWQHDVYNSGMLVEAGVHYYKATGKTKLLTVATKLANYMVSEMGPAPKKNIVPAHSGPEEAMMKLYWLYKNDPALKEEISVPVKENDYYELAKFWIGNRGHHVGFPLWKAWGNDSSEHWIKAVKYNDPKFGDHTRPTWGDYAQDSIPVLQQKTIEGHAVRATLLATGITATALESHDPKYIQTVDTLWDNMVGNRMFITGGVGAIAHDEKFGSDFFLPNNAYLETCAAVGVGFFSQRMNQLKADGKYMDEFERALYNNVLTGISATGTNYTYQNPLSSETHRRWGWHDCPCCPPMFLKIVSAVPDFIYMYKDEQLYVNLFIDNDATVTYKDEKVKLKMTTNYPWDGKVLLEILDDSDLPVNMRIPGWAVGSENPLGLYNSKNGSSFDLKINEEKIDGTITHGYVSIKRKWKSGDKIELNLNMNPRFVYANQNVTDLKGQVAIASGPIVYSLEKNLNRELESILIDTRAPMKLETQETMNIITGSATVNNQAVPFVAIPYYLIGNLKPGDAYKVWVRSK